MLVILAVVTVSHIISVILLFISAINNAWWISGSVHVDLWFTCNVTCVPLVSGGSDTAGYLEAVQACMILAVIVCCMGFIVFILQLFRLKQGERFILTAGVQHLSALFVLIGASVYSVQHENFHGSSVREGNYGYSFVLAWVAFVFTFASGVMYLTLRKRK